MPTKAKDSIPALDGLRAIAVLLVITFHFTMFLPKQDWFGSSLERLTSLGWSGVEIFFALSGFLITRNLLAARGAENYWVSFYARRGLRIFPLYAALLAFMYLLLVFAPTFPSASLANTLRVQWLWLWANASNVVMIRGYSLGCLRPCWSLAVEEQFYLVWPLVIYLTSGQRLARFCFVVWLATLAGRLALRAWGVFPPSIYVCTPVRLDGFVAGALLAVWERDGRTEWPGWLSRPVVAISAAWLVFGLCWSGASQDSWPMQTFGHTAFAVLSAAWIWREKRRNGTRSWLTAPMLRTIGRYSYCLYLVHYPIFFVWNRLRALDHLLAHFPSAVSEVIYLLVPILIAFGVAALSDRFFEGPILALKRYFSIRRHEAADEPALSRLSSRR